MGHPADGAHPRLTCQLEARDLFAGGGLIAGMSELVFADVSSGALEAGQSRSVSPLARAILPRPGEPFDVRKLYIEESETNARRAHAPTRTTLEIGAESEVSFATYFNAFPASYWRRWSILESVVLRVELTGRARVDVYRSKSTGARITVGGAPLVSESDDQPAVLEFEIELAPFEDGGWIWFDITTDAKSTLHHAGWYAPIARARQGERRGRHPDVQPAVGRCQRARRADLGSGGRRGDQRGHRLGSGHQEGQGSSRVRGRSGVFPTPSFPRRHSPLIHTITLPTLAGPRPA